MSDQPSLLPEDPPAPETGVCAWSTDEAPCEPATRRLEVEKTRYRTHEAPGLDGQLRRVRVVAKHAIRPWCCDKHLRSLHRNNHDTNPAPGVAIK